jgi:SNF family Na+-dependent transporter
MKSLIKLALMPSLMILSPMVFAFNIHFSEITNDTNMKMGQNAGQIFFNTSPNIGSVIYWGATTNNLTEFSNQTLSNIAGNSVTVKFSVCTGDCNTLPSNFVLNPSCVKTFTPKTVNIVRNVTITQTGCEWQYDYKK